MTNDTAYIESLQEELIRVTCRGEVFTVNGKPVEGATESDVIKHLTSGRDYITGRRHRFPGIGSGWVFDNAIQRAGFKIVSATNRRGQACRIVTL